MSIRKRIEQEPVVNRVEIKCGDTKYLLVGSPDANLMADSLLLREDQVALYAKHWSTHLGQTVDPELVKHIVIVHKVLQPCWWDNDTEKWVDEDPYDVTDVARLSQRDGKLFMELVGGAFRALGLSESDKDHTMFDEVASGN